MKWQEGTLLPPAQRSHFKGYWSERLIQFEAPPVILSISNPSLTRWVFLFATISGPAAYRRGMERKEQPQQTDLVCFLESSTLRNERGWLIAMMMGARLPNSADAPKKNAAEQPFVTQLLFFAFLRVIIVATTVIFLDSWSWCNR